MLVRATTQYPIDSTRDTEHYQNGHNEKLGNQKDDKISEEIIIETHEEEPYRGRSSLQSR